MRQLLDVSDSSTQDLTSAIQSKVEKYLESGDVERYLHYTFTPVLVILLVWLYPLLEVEISGISALFNSFTLCR